MARRSDVELAELTPKFRERLATGETLDDILPEAFAAVREVSKRILNMRHFDVQLIGGIVLHRGRIAEMKTGEGKTLVATLPAYLNALEGKGRSHRHGQRLSGRTRRRMDGQDLPGARPDGRLHPASADGRRTQSRLCRRYHLRHQQRIRDSTTSATT